MVTLLSNNVLGKVKKIIFFYSCLVLPSGKNVALDNDQNLQNDSLLWEFEIANRSFDPSRVALFLVSNRTSTASY